jgi:hypothetical protein
MATLAPQTITLAGLTPTGAAVSAADKFAPGPTTFLYVRNTGGAPCDVTVDSKVPSNYGTDVNIGPVTVAATTGEVMLGPFPAQRFAGTDGLADVTFSAQTGVTARPIRF